MSWRCKPEICSLDLNTMWFGSAVVINTPQDNAQIMAEAIRAAGVMPELEVFDSGDLQLAHQLLADGVLARPGPVPGRARHPQRLSGDPGDPALRRGRCCPPMPCGRPWASGAWSSRSSPRPACSAATSGSGSRTIIYLSKGVLAPSNAALVERAAQLVELLGRSVATPAEAREILGLRPR